MEMMMNKKKMIMIINQVQANINPTKFHLNYNLVYLRLRRRLMICKEI